MCWNGEKFLDSLMDCSDFRAVWEKGIEQNGSSTRAVYVDELGSSLEDGQGYIIETIE